MKNFNETVLNNWLAELQKTIVSNSMNGANRDGIQVWSDDDDKLYCYCATSDNDVQVYDLTIDGAKQLETENNLEHSIKGYKSVERVHDRTVELTLDQLTIGALNDWLINSSEYIINVDNLENDEITWELFVDLMKRQLATDDDLLNYNYIYCGIYDYDTKAFDDLEELYTFEEWSDLLDEDENLFDCIMEYAG